MNVRDLRSGARYDLSIVGPWGMRLNYINVSYEGLIKRPRSEGSDPIEILLFWAEHDAKIGPTPVTAIPEQVLAVNPR
jgi:hypothetical protein